MGKKGVKVVKAEFFCIFFFSYPTLFTIDRANLELYLFLAICFFVYFYYYADKPMVAAFFLAVAISMKLYPGILVLLFIKNRDVKTLLYTIFYCSVLSLLSVALFKGGFVNNITWMLESLSNYNRNSGAGGIQHNSSLYGMLKISLFAIVVVLNTLRGIASDENTLIQLEGILVPYYYLLVLVIFVLLVLFFLRKKASFHDSLLLLVISFILLPNVSRDYKLISLLIPLFLYLYAIKKEEQSKLITWCYGLLLVPKDYIILFKDVSINSLFNPFIMVIMSVFIIRKYLKNAES